MSTTTALEGARSFARRDQLLKIQREAQKRWEEADVFKAEAGAESPVEGEKFFGNFPYPYMNGTLHLGHAFSLSKLEFASAYHRLRGRNVLFPFSFYCTGIPIKACADKLDRDTSIQVFIAFEDRDTSIWAKLWYISKFGVWSADLKVKRRRQASVVHWLEPW